MKCDFCDKTDTETKIIVSKFGTLCRKHYLQMYRHGEIKRTIYDSNDYKIMGDYTIIFTYNKKANKTRDVLIDTEDLDKVKNYKIGMATGGYARIQLGDKRIFLHNYLFPNYNMIDHINRNKLDNRKSNLRLIDKQNNAYNVDKGMYKGIKQVPSGNWTSVIMVNYKTIYLGTFLTKEEALYNRYLADLKYCPDTRDKKYDTEKFEIFEKFKFI